MTETRKWVAGAVAAALLIVGASWFLLISPKRAEVADLNAQAESQESANSKLQMDLEILKPQNKDLPEKQAELAVLKTQIPESAELPSYIREMEELGTESGISFTSLTPAAPTAVGAVATVDGALPPETLASINVDMVLTGSYFEIVDFVNELETASRYTLLSGYTLTSEGSEEAGSTTGGQQDLTATLNARIYLVPSAETTVDAATDPATEPTAP